MITRDDLEKKSDAELLEMQQAEWTIGAKDDEEWQKRCAEQPFDRKSVIDFILDCEANSDQ